MKGDNNYYNHKQTVENLNLIFDKSKNSKMEFRADLKLDTAVNLIASQFNITRIQASLFAVIFIFNVDESEIGTERILSFFGFKLPDFYTIKSDLEKLIQLGLIKTKRETNSNNLYNSTFIVNQKVLDAIFSNIKVEYVLNEPELTFIQICSFAKKIAKKTARNNSTLSELLRIVQAVEDKNSALPQIQKLKDLKIEIEERMVLYYLIDQLTDNEPEVDLRMILVEIFGLENYSSLAAQFMQSDQDLQLKGLVKVNSNGYIEDATIFLTEKAQQLLLADAAILYKNTPKTDHTIIRHESIVAKELFFNEKQKKEIDFFTDSIKEENLERLKLKLKESGFEKSIICLLVGVPGGGKTELVKQISKSLRYDLFVLDFTKMKSAYFSESQKLVRDSFNSFREIAKSDERPMILLINEADGLLHNRIEGSRSQSSDQTQNEIQSILLEEFEKGGSIIILTTNLINNIDSAFYRRFLFKIKFDYPDKSTMKKIYKSKLEWLNEDQLEELSHIQLSGGEIDNVVVKVLMYEVFHSEKPTTYQLIDFCSQEKVEKRKLPKMGF